MRRIAIAAGKGGVGKSSIALGLASVFVERGARVLLVDVDPQGNATWGAGAEPQRDGGAADFILGRDTAPQLVGGLAVLAGGPALLGADIARADPEALADALDTVQGFAVAIIDTPPGAPGLERLGLVAADVVLVVVDAHPFSLSGAGRVVEDLSARQKKRRRGPDRWALVASKVDQRRTADRDLPTALAAMFPGVPLLSVPQDSALAGATADRRPLLETAPNSRAAEALGIVADWIVEA